jgi:hypothetical protein
MAPQEATLHQAQDWLLDEAEKEGCGARGHRFLCQALRTNAGEMRQGFADTQQQIAMVPALVAQHVKTMRTESRIAPLWEIIRALPLPWRFALIVALFAGGPSAFVATVGAVAREMLRAPVTMSAPDIAGQVGQVGP